MTKPCKVGRSVPAIICAVTAFVSRSFMPLTAVLQTAPRPARSFLPPYLFFSFPPRYISSTSTGPTKALARSFQVSPIRWAKCHAVFCVMPKSR